MQMMRTIRVTKVSEDTLVIKGTIEYRVEFIYHNYTEGIPTISFMLGTARGRKYTTKMPVKATASPVNCCVSVK